MAELTSEIIKLNEKTLAKLSTLDKTKVYLIEIDTRGVKDNLAEAELAVNFRLALSKLGIESLIIPNCDFEHPMLRINELSKYLEK